MKTESLLCSILILLLTTFSHGDIVVPGADGTDGALVVESNLVIDLSEAVTGNWDDPNGANAGKGVYDPEKWAVVFKYSEVTINAGTTVTFKNHPSRAPVVWLVNGNVTINGTVALNGQASQLAPRLAEPGPGGFRGGPGNFGGGVARGAGLGPGGGFIDERGGQYGSGGERYGNPSLLPLIGGSGGASSLRENTGWGGGAGGGAILIACVNTTRIAGSIQADGGEGVQIRFDGSRVGGGSGGGVRIVSHTVEGAGLVRAIAGIGGTNGAATPGRIRVERVSTDGATDVVPSPSIVPLQDDDTALLWPPSNAPKVTITSLGGEGAPVDPRSSFGTFGADVVVAETNTVEAVIETENVEDSSQVIVRITPRGNGNATEVVATRDLNVNDDPLRWTADLPTNVGYSAIQVRVVRP